MTSSTPLHQSQPFPYHVVTPLANQNPGIKTRPGVLYRVWYILLSLTNTQKRQSAVKALRGKIFHYYTQRKFSAALCFSFSARFLENTLAHFIVRNIETDDWLPPKTHLVVGEKSLRGVSEKSAITFCFEPTESFRFSLILRFMPKSKNLKIN